MAEWKNYDETSFNDFGSVGETMPAEGSDFGSGFGETMPADGAGFGNPYDRSTVPEVSGAAGAAPQGTDGWGAAEETKFEWPGIEKTNGATVRPATGWLVCVEGKAKGEDYRLYMGYSYIGRDPAKNQVAIPDDHISSVPSARILYDTESRKFYLNECDGARNPVYLNDKLFDGRVELQPYDMLKLGNTKLLFVPLCTEKFAWEE